jgi:hypothetical protein
MEKERLNCFAIETIGFDGGLLIEGEGREQLITFQLGLKQLVAGDDFFEI